MSYAYLRLLVNELYDIVRIIVLRDYWCVTAERKNKKIIIKKNQWKNSFRKSKTNFKQSLDISKNLIKH